MLFIIFFILATVFARGGAERYYLVDRMIASTQGQANADCKRQHSAARLHCDGSSLSLLPLFVLCSWRVR